MVAPFMPDAEKLAAVREGLPATAAGIYLDTATAGPIPAETAAAMAQVTDRELRIGRAAPDDEETLQRLAEARAAVAAVLTSDPDRVALTHGATDALNLAVGSLDWRPADEVVTTRHEHPAALAALTVIRDRFGVTLTFVDVDTGGDDERTLAAFEAAVHGRTRMMVISHVLWMTGALMPVRELSELARSRGVAVVVDGAQAAGAIPVDTGWIGADFYALSARKWLLGPAGMGALVVGAAESDRFRPPAAGVLGFEHLDREARGRSWVTARRWEVSNFHEPSVVGFARSCGWLSMFVGLEWIHQRGASLARSIAARLAAIPGVVVLTALDRMATVVTFRIEGWPSETAAAELGRRSFAILRLVPTLDAIRISVAFFNTEAELERFAGAVAELAHHTPATLPPRPSLMVVPADDR